MFELRNQPLVSLLEGRFATLANDHESYTIHIQENPSCKTGCPAGVDVKAYINLISHQQYEQAVQVILRDNPFPGICGMVCHHPCENHCEMSSSHTPIAIRALKRFVADYSRSNRASTLESIAHLFSERIAVIGSGPVGLTTAYFLTKWGYPVTIYEDSNQLGQSFRAYYNEDQLPQLVLEDDVQRIVSLGIHAHLNTRVTNVSVLLEKEYQAVLVTLPYLISSTPPPHDQNSSLHRGLFEFPDTLSDSFQTVDAIAKGKQLAQEIRGYLRGDANPFTIKTMPVIVKPLPHYSPPISRSSAPHQTVLTEEQAIQEAQYCQHCGSCYQCDVCLTECGYKQIMIGIADSKHEGADPSHETAFLMKVPAALSKTLTEQGPQPFVLTLESGKNVNARLYSTTPSIHHDPCILCGACIESCAYHAIHSKVDSNKETYLEVDHDACRSCGACIGVCPTDAIQIPIFSNQRLGQQVDSSAGNDIVLLACQWAMPYHTFNHQPEIVDLICSRRISPSMLIQAMTKGIKGVIIEFCGKDHCHYLSATDPLTNVFRTTTETLIQLGINRERLRLFPIQHGTHPGIFYYIYQAQSKNARRERLPKYQLAWDHLPEIMKEWISLQILSVETEMFPEGSPHAFFLTGNTVILDRILQHHRYPSTLLSSIKVILKHLGIPTNTMIHGIIDQPMDESWAPMYQEFENKLTIRSNHLIETKKPKYMISADNYLITRLRNLKGNHPFSGSTDGYPNLISLASLILEKKHAFTFQPTRLRVGIQTSKALSNASAEIHKMLSLIPGIEIYTYETSFPRNGWLTMSRDRLRETHRFLDSLNSDHIDAYIPLDEYEFMCLRLCHKSGADPAPNLEILDPYTLFCRMLA